MVEETMTDGLGNVLTIQYDNVNDEVLIRNTGIDGEFRQVYLNSSSLVTDNVITIESVNGPEQWEGYTDDLGRSFIQSFWETNKIDKDTRGL